jgi:hypothetical protein
MLPLRCFLDTYHFVSGGHHRSSFFLFLYDPNLKTIAARPLGEPSKRKSRRDLRPESACAYGIMGAMLTGAKEIGQMKRSQRLALAVSSGIAGGIGIGVVVGAAARLTPQLTGLLAGLLSALLGAVGIMITRRLVDG